MKVLNQRSAKIFNKLIALLPEPEAYQTAVVVDNTEGAFMPVYFERLHKNTVIFGMKCDTYTLAHYYKQNGDMVPDPDMEFAVLVDNPTMIFPMSFEARGMFSTRSVFFKNGKWWWNKKAQVGEASFANIWLNNIKHQQKI